MKHRSVIAFVIVAAALFAAPQLSHDLQSFRDALGSRLRGHLMHAFLSMPAGEAATPATAPALPARTSPETCSKGRTATRTRKAGSAAPARAEHRADQVDGEQAMITEPLPGPGPWTASLPAGARVRTAELPNEAELAMIIPPDLGLTPPSAASAGREVERRALKMATDVRVAYVATRVEGKGAAEWVKQGEALQRRLEAGLPAGVYEFRVDRDGSKRKVLKVKGGGPCCPAPAPRAPRPSVQAAAAAPLPTVTSFEVLHSFAGE